MLPPDKRMTFGERMENVERNTKKISTLPGNKGRKMYAKIIVLSSDYVDNLTEQISKHSIPDEMKIWSKGNLHYAMLFYHNWKEPV